MMHSLNLWTYLVEVGMAIKFGAYHKVTSMGRWGLPSIHEEVWTEASEGILGAVVGMDQHSTTTLPVSFMLRR